MRWVTTQRFALTYAIFQVFFLGCGGGGGGGDEGGSAPPGPQPSDRAPTTLLGRELVLFGSSTRRIAFEDAGNSWTETRDGVQSGGTYQYTATGDLGELVFEQSGAYFVFRLSFSSAEAGAYTMDGGGEAGTFELAAQTNPGGQAGEDPGTVGRAPVTMEGRTLYGTRTFTSTGPVGQTHVYTFTGSSFHDSDPPEESDGGYRYEPSGDSATLTLNYYSPQEFNGDRHELMMNFSTESAGWFESTYTRRDGTVIRINGTFRIE